MDSFRRDIRPCSGQKRALPFVQPAQFEKRAADVEHATPFHGDAEHLQKGGFRLRIAARFAVDPSEDQRNIYHGLHIRIRFEMGSCLLGVFYRARDVRDRERRLRLQAQWPRNKVTPLSLAGHPYRLAQHSTGGVETPGVLCQLREIAKAVDTRGRVFQLLG